MNRFADAAVTSATSTRNPFWKDRTIDDYFSEMAARAPNKLAVVAYRSDAGDAPVKHLSYAQLGKFVDRFAGALRALGVGRGDIVAIQLPNWWEFVVASLAVGRLGAVLNPLMPIFRERELSFMLGLTEAKVLIVPSTFRGFDHAAMAHGLKSQLPALNHVIVVGGNGPNAFDTLLEPGHGDDVPYVPDAGLNPDEFALLMFTSGTTGEPKGVMHSSNTLVCLTYAFANRAHLDASTVIFGCSPIGHMTGYAAAMLQSIRMGATLVLLDAWEAARAVRIMAAERITYVMAATSFLSDICNAVANGGPKPTALRAYLCGGAPIPPALVERAQRELGVPVCSEWGMTESLLGTLTEPERAAEKSVKTDGCPVEGMEVRVVDDQGTPVPAGVTGMLMARGAQMFLGYFKRPDIPTVDADGWFNTGDLAFADEEGYIRINGRAKDVLIRGGENIPVIEIESLLYQHPLVVEVAIVGYPDERLGERSCAFVTLKPGTTLTLSDVQAWMAQHKTAKQYWPERLEILQSLPRTLSGKIQKFILKEQLKNDRA